MLSGKALSPAAKTARDGLEVPTERGSKPNDVAQALAFPSVLVWSREVKFSWEPAGGQCLLVHWRCIGECLLVVQNVRHTPANCGWEVFQDHRG